MRILFPYRCSSMKPFCLRSSRFRVTAAWVEPMANSSCLRFNPYGTSVSVFSMRSWVRFSIGSDIENNIPLSSYKVSHYTHFTRLTRGGRIFFATR